MRSDPSETNRFMYMVRFWYHDGITVVSQSYHVGIIMVSPIDGISAIEIWLRILSVRDDSDVVDSHP